MTAALLVEQPTVLAAHVATAGVGSLPPAVDDLPDPARDFFPGCVTTYTLPPYEFPLGPPSPLSRTLAQVVKDIAS